MMRYAFINASGVVINVISGALTTSEQARLLADYGALFGAVAMIEIDSETAVWIGGSYIDGVFTAPPAPEPQPEPVPEIVEPEA